MKAQENTTEMAQIDHPDPKIVGFFMNPGMPVIPHRGLLDPCGLEALLPVSTPEIPQFGKVGSLVFLHGTGLRKRQVQG